MEIYGTLGPACREERVLEEMFRAGMTGMRLNLSHTSLEESAPLLARMDRAAAACGAARSLIIDLQGPELRLGERGLPLALEAGSSLELAVLPLPPAVRERLRPGACLLMDDGRLRLRVGEDGARGEVLRGGVLLPKKSVALEGTDVALPPLTAEDLRHLSLARRFGVTGVMQPFVRGREDLIFVRKALEQNGCKGIKLYAKLENAAGLATLEEWIDLADVLVIARGDLGQALPLWTLPAWQKTIAALARERGVPFLVVTQMLASMEQSPVPTRAEVSDVFNAVLDGADAVMLTGETAAGRYPAEAMRAFCRTVAEGIRFRKGERPPLGGPEEHHGLH